MAEGGHHTRNRPPTLGTTSVDFYHYPLTVWAYSTPQPHTEVPAPRGGLFKARVEIPVKTWTLFYMYKCLCMVYKFHIAIFVHKIHEMYTRRQLCLHTVYPKKYAHGFRFAVLCCGYTLTDFPISIRLTSLALWQSNDCPSASKATLMNMDKYFMWVHYERLHNQNKAKHNKTVCIFLGIYCILVSYLPADTPYLQWHGQYHDDIVKWKHFPSYRPFVRGIHWSLVNSPHKDQWCRALTFSLICAWMNSWVNDHEAGIWDANAPIMT